MNTRPAEPALDTTPSITLHDVLRFLRRGIVYAAAMAAIAGGVAYLVSSAQTPLYRASAGLLASQSNAAYVQFGLVAPPPLDPTVYRSAVLEGHVLANALRRIEGRELGEQELGRALGMVSVRIAQQQISSVLWVDVEHESRTYAARLANAVADELILWDRQRLPRTFERAVVPLEQEIADIDASIAAIDAGAEAPAGRREELALLRQQRVADLEAVRARLSGTAPGIMVGLLESLRVATPPDRPFAPRVMMTSLLAALWGLLAGYGYLFLQWSIDTRVRSRAELGKLTGLPVLAEFPRRGRRATRLSSESASFFLTSVLGATRHAQARVIVVTSPKDPQEKDGIAVSLAESAARANHRTLLIDGDLRHPATTEWLDIVPSHAAPFEVYLSNPRHRYLPVTVSVGTKRSFDFIPSFTSARYPVELINQGFLEQLEAWQASYDTIVIDSTPVLAFADTLALAPMCTGAVVCTRFAETTRDDVAQTLELLRRAHVQVLGTVLTDLPSTRRERRGAREEDFTLVDPYKTSVPGSRTALDPAPKKV